jgi:hypothetical protein
MSVGIWIVSSQSDIQRPTSPDEERVNLKDELASEQADLGVVLPYRLQGW